MRASVPNISMGSTRIATPHMITIDSRTWASVETPPTMKPTINTRSSSRTNAPDSRVLPKATAISNISSREVATRIVAATSSSSDRSISSRTTNTSRGLMIRGSLISSSSSRGLLGLDTTTRKKRLDPSPNNSCSSQHSGAPPTKPTS